MNLSLAFPFDQKDPSAGCPVADMGAGRNITGELLDERRWSLRQPLVTGGNLRPVRREPFCREVSLGQKSGRPARQGGSSTPHGEATHSGRKWYMTCTEVIASLRAS